MTTEGEAFSNTVVSADQLPSLDTLVYEPLSPRYRTLNLAIAAAIFITLLVVVNFIRFQPFVTLPEGLLFAWPVVTTGLLALWGLLSVYHWLADPLLQFSLREQDLSVHKGLIFRSITCQPVLRIQHIELKRGPLERLAGLATLQVFSAGGAGHTFEIPGLPVAQAQKIRQFILDHKDVGAR